MRSLLARYAGTVAVAVVAGSCAAPTQGPSDVRVTIACTNGPVNVTINGWVIHRTPNSALRISFSGGGGGISSVTVTPKDAARWDFDPQPTAGSYTIENNDDLDLTVRQGASGLYRYTITGQCTSGSGETNSVTIDPDIVVD